MQSSYDNWTLTLLRNENFPPAPLTGRKRIAMHNEDGTLLHASLQHFIRRKPCRYIDDVQEHG